jgi:signal transduction histidine kinase
MSKLKLILTGFLAGFFILVFSINSTAEDVKYLNNKLNNAKNDEEKLNYLLKLTDIYINNNDTLAQRYAQKTIKLADNLDNVNLKIKAYHQCGRAHQLVSNYTLAINYFLRAKNLCIEIGNKKSLANIYRDLGESYRSFFEYSSSLNYLNKSLKLYIRLNDKIGEAKALNRIGAVYAEFDNIKDRNKSLYYVNKSNKIANYEQDFDLLASNHLLIGANYSYLKQYDKAFDNLSKSLAFFNRTKNVQDKSLILRNIAIVYFRQSDYSNTIKYGQLAYRDAIQNNNLTYIWLSTNLLFIVYEKIHNSDSALKYLGITSDARSTLYMKEKDMAVYKSEAKYQKDLYEFEKKEEKQQEQERTIFFIVILILVLASLSFSLMRLRKLKITYKELNIQKKIIENQKHELALVNNTKDKFFSIIAHDLRSPFNSILGLSRELEYSVEQMEPNEIKDFARGINKASQITYNLLENLLEWAKLQIGIIKPNREILEIRNLIDLIVNLVEVQAYKKAITINTQKVTNDNVFADENMLTSVIRNLITNAIKFSPKNKSIIVSSDIIGDMLCVTIKDEGIGINAEQLSQLFNIEHTKSMPGTENETGSGLGLILCKELIEKQGGSISVQSELGVGSSFAITIPLAK